MGALSVNLDYKTLLYGEALTSRMCILTERLFGAFQPKESNPPRMQSTAPGGLCIINQFDQMPSLGQSACLPEIDCRELEARGQLTKKKAMVFAKASHANSDLRIWLEDIFDLELTNVYEPIGYFEWLLKCGKDTELFIIDADSFASDKLLMRKFCEAIRSSFPSRPIIVLDCNAPRNEFLSVEENGVNVKLTSPTSRTAVWLGVKAAMDQHHFS